MFASLADELAADDRSLTELIDRIEDVAGIPRIVLGREIPRLPQLLQLPRAPRRGDPARSSTGAD
jgi:hypothetical protein